MLQQYKLKNMYYVGDSSLNLYFETPLQLTFNQAAALVKENKEKHGHLESTSKACSFRWLEKHDAEEVGFVKDIVPNGCIS